MSKLHQFARSVSVQDLQLHFERNGVPLPGCLQEDELAPDFPKRFVAAVDEISAAERIQLLAEIERICDMTDEVGQAALLGLPDWRERLKAIEGAHRRAHWLYMQSAEAFRQAEEIRYADENMNAQRLWDGFVGLRAELKSDPSTDEPFLAALKRVLGAEHIVVEAFNRLRHQKGEPEHSVIQITVYSDDVPVDEVVFANPGVRNAVRKPVRETAITYEPDSGTIEVVGRVRELREEVAKVFAEKLLGQDLDGARLPPRWVNLEPLLDPIDLAVEPQDGIAQVKLTELAISSTDSSLTQTFRVPFKAEETLHEVLEDQYGDSNPLRVVQRPWRARIEFQFEPEIGRKRGKKINAILSAPSKVNLLGKTERERLVLNKYLRRWGLLRGTAA